MGRFRSKSNEMINSCTIPVNDISQNAICCEGKVLVRAFNKEKVPRGLLQHFRNFYISNLHTSPHARARDCPLPVHLRDVPAASLLRLRSLLLHQEQDRVRPQQRAHPAQGQGGLCAETGVNIIVIR